MTLEIEAPATIEMNGTETDAQIKMQVIQETDQTDKAESPAADQSEHSRRRQENGLNETCLKKTGQYGSCNPVPDCVRLILCDEITPLELMPDMNMSMMIVMTVYPGASPDDVSELVTKPIEDRASTLSGLDTISSPVKGEYVHRHAKV